MARFDAREWLNEYLKSRLGEPILTALPSERKAMDYAVRNSLIEYWSAFPHEYRMTFRVNPGRSRSSFDIPEQDVLDKAFANDSGNSRVTVEYPAVTVNSDSYGSAARPMAYPADSTEYLPMRPGTVGVKVNRRQYLNLSLKDNGSGMLLPAGGDESDPGGRWGSNAIAHIDYNTGDFYMMGLEGRDALHDEDEVTMTFVEKNDRKRKASVLGIVRLDDTVASPDPEVGNIFGFNNDLSRFSNKGLGFWTGRSVNTELDLLNVSEEDHVFGEIEYSYDVADRVYHFIGPNDIYDLSIWWAIGFMGDTELELLRPSNILVFSKLVTKEFLDIIIKARSLVEISSDTTLNISALETQYSDLKEELREDLFKRVQVPALYG